MRKNILYYLSCAGAILSSFLIFLLHRYRLKVMAAYNLEPARLRALIPVNYGISAEFVSLYGVLVLLACICVGYVLISWVRWGLKCKDEHNTKREKGECRDER